MAGILKAVKGFFLAVFALTLVLAGVILGGYLYFNSPPAETPTGLADGVFFFEVHRGETARSVGRRLEEAGIIRDQRFWHVISRMNAEHIKAGLYNLPFPATQRDIHGELIAGGMPILNRVTIPEGVTLSRAAALMEEAGILYAADFMEAASDPELVAYFNIPGRTMEGFLFPDTYLFPPNHPADLVVRAMAENFFRRVAEVYDGALEMDRAELFNKVILASIVEREYRIDEEAAVMAGVFLNRLDIRMRLQSCATVEYVITEILGRPHPRVILIRDTQIDNPYNTYMFAGLPPGPISAPGSVALNAVFNPTSSYYLYFRLVDVATGRHHFSRTYEEHVRAGSLLARGNI